MAVPSLASSEPVRDRTDEVMAADRALARAVAEHDFDLFRSLIADDATFFGSSEIHQGREAVVEAWSSLLAVDRKTELSWEPETAEIAASEDLAFTVGSYELTTIGDDGSKRMAEGTYVTIWKKDAAGRWRARLDIGTPPERREPPAVSAISAPPASTPPTESPAVASPAAPAVAPPPIEVADSKKMPIEPSRSSPESASPEPAEEDRTAPLRRRRRCHTLDNFDENDDLVIDFRDRYWRYFYVWQDRDRNGIKGDGETVSVYELGVRSIDLDLASFGREKGGGGIRVTDRIVLDIDSNGFGGADDGILVIDASRLGRGGGPDLVDPDASDSVGLTELRAGMKLRTESEIVELDCP